MKVSNLFLTPALTKEVERQVSLSKALPDKGQISRGRLIFDCAWMLVQRCLHWVACMKGEHFSRHLVCDSSPQYHKDYGTQLKLLIT